MGLLSFPRRGGILGDFPLAIPNRPLPFPDPVTVPNRPRIAPTQAAGAPSIMDAIGQIFSGQDDPNLSPEQNAQARKQAMLNAGLQMLAMSSQGVPTVGVLAQGAMAGQQFGAGAREQTYAATQAERLQQALSDPELLAMLTPQQQRLFRLLPPQEATRLLAEILTAPGPESKVVGEGGALVGPNGELLYQNARAADLMDGLPQGFIARISASGIDYASATPEEKTALLEQWLRDQERGNSAGATRINLNTGAQTAEGVTQIALKDYETVSTNATTAQGKLNNLAAMEAMLDAGMTTGRLDNLLTPLRGYAASLGIDAGDLSQEQLFGSISNRLALQARGAGEMPGPMSDRDIQFLQNMVPQIANTVEGNRLLIDVLARQAQREIDLLQLANQYIAEHGTLDHLWLQYKNEWMRNNPLFDDMRTGF